MINTLVRLRNYKVNELQLCKWLKTNIYNKNIDFSLNRNSTFHDNQSDIYNYIFVHTTYVLFFYGYYLRTKLTRKCIFEIIIISLCKYTRWSDYHKDLIRAYWLIFTRNRHFCRFDCM